MDRDADADGASLVAFPALNWPSIVWVDIADAPGESCRARQRLSAGVVARAIVTASWSNPMTATITIFPNEPIGTITRNIYGHFAEHLGNCIYDGIWRAATPATWSRGRRGAETGQPAGPALAGRLLRRRLPLAGRHRPARAAARAGSTSTGARSSRTTLWHARVRRLLPRYRRRALLLRQRRQRHAARDARLGRVLQLPRRQHAGAICAPPTARSRTLGVALLGRRQRELGLRRHYAAGGVLPPSTAATPPTCATSAATHST